MFCAHQAPWGRPHADRTGGREEKPRALMQVLEETVRSGPRWRPHRPDLEDGAPTAMCPWDLSYFVTIPQASKQVPDTIRGRPSPSASQRRLCSVGSAEAASSPHPPPSPPLPPPFRKHTQPPVVSPGAWQGSLLFKP